MIGIVFSTLEEAQPFLDRYERGRLSGLMEAETLHDDHVLVSLTGLGKIKATLHTERMLQRFRKSLGLTRILHVGTCTSLTEDLPVGAVVGASQVFEGDRIELSTPTYPRMPLEVPFPDLPRGTLVTQDHTAQEPSELSYWQRIADMTDMVGYATAYVTATHGLPCHIVKVVTGFMQHPDGQLMQTLSEAHNAIADFLLSEIDTLRTA
jgi:nucleoside phosphorylase